MKKAAYIALFFFVVTVNVTGQESSPSKKSKHSFGFNVGMTSGLGFSYRYMSDKFGFQVASIPVFTQEQKLFLFQGFEFDFITKKKEKVDQFIYIANGLVFSREREIYTYNEYLSYSEPNGKTVHVDEVTMDYLYRAGGGWGIRIKGENKLDLTLRIGGLWYSRFGFLPSAGVGLHYRL